VSKNLLCISAFIFSIITTHAQEKETQTVNQVWTGYFNQTRLSDKWGIWFDGHLRTKMIFLKIFPKALQGLD
jgi:hypothetical protein